MEPVEHATVAVRAKPKGAKNVVLGVATADDGKSELVVQVSAAPEAGKANKAICETIAKALGVAKGKVRVARGEASRHKMVEVTLPAKDLEDWMAALPRL